MAVEPGIWSLRDGPSGPSTPKRADPSQKEECVGGESNTLEQHEDPGKCLEGQ